VVVVEEAETKVSVEVGGALAAGNVEFQSAQGRAVVTHRWSRNGVALNVTGNIGRSIVDGDEDGILSDAERDLGFQETARRLNAEGRYDRFVAKRSSVYALAGALLDPYAGYDLRTHEQLGVSRRFIDKEKFKLTSELGIDFAQEDYVDGIDPNSQNVLAARVFLGTAWMPSEKVSVTNDLEAYENLLDPEDLRLLDTLAVSAGLSDVFSVKTSYALVFDNVPVELSHPLIRPQRRRAC
jgi:putative salt-induced outer membrane protein YdiY